MRKTKFAVITDSACDLPQELAKQNNVEIMNFDIVVGGVNYEDRVDFDFDDYYEILRTCEAVPSTAHITVPRFLNKFEKLDNDGIEQVLLVLINANGSATNAAAQMAKEKFEKKNNRMKIFIVDSHSYSMAYGWYVARAARKLQNGAAMQEVVLWLEDVFSKSEITLAAFSLKFMKKSGRISAVAAFAGELLGLRPIISLNDGVSVVRKKVRGDKEVLPNMIEFASGRMDDTCEYMVGGTNQKIVDELAKLCEKKWKTSPMTKFKLGAAVSTNTGPDAVAIIFLGEKRKR